MLEFEEGFEVQIELKGVVWAWGEGVLKVGHGDGLFFGVCQRLGVAVREMETVVFGDPLFELGDGDVFVFSFFEFFLCDAGAEGLSGIKRDGGQGKVFF